VGPFRGERARGLAPSAGVSEGGFRPELTTECGSTPTARSKQSLLDPERSEIVRDGMEYYVFNAHVAQLVEHVLGKDEVTRSIRVVGSRKDGDE
jgi:hypothetical protein